jgi:ketosteroid isomerase-like protein
MNAMNANAIAETYLDLWNETDAARRGALLREHWMPGATYVDPLMRGAGAEEVAGLIAAVQERFPGFRFRLRGTPDGHGAHCRFAWSFGPAEGEAPLAGFDVVRLEAGRIAEVVGFLDRAPAA